MFNELNENKDGQLNKIRKITYEQNENGNKDTNYKK